MASMFSFNQLQMNDLLLLPDKMFAQSRFCAGESLKPGIGKTPVRHALNGILNRRFRLSGFSPTRNFSPYPGGFYYNRYMHCLMAVQKGSLSRVCRACVLKNQSY